MHCCFQFSKESGHQIEECKLQVVYVDPPRAPSPVREESEEGSSPRVSFSDNGNLSSSEQTVKSVACLDFRISSGFCIDLSICLFYFKKCFCDWVLCVGFKILCW